MISSLGLAFTGKVLHRIGNLTDPLCGWQDFLGHYQQNAFSPLLLPHDE